MGKYLAPLDLVKNELQNARIQNLAVAPSGPVAGQIYYDTVANSLYFYNGTAWTVIGTGTGHNAVTLTTAADVLLGLSGQIIDLDTQSINVVFAGPSSGGSGVPTFRALVVADIPSLTHDKISDFDAGVRSNTLNDMAAPVADLSIASHKLTNVTDPTSAQDAATKAYVDSVAQGLDVKASVKAASVGTLTLSGAQTVDTVALVAGDRVLVKNQGTATQNGIYTVAAGAWVRSTDADTWVKLPGAFVFVEQGSQADTGWVCTVDVGGTLGSTNVTFAQFSGAGTYVAGTGLTLTGNSFAVNFGTGATQVAAGNHTHTGLSRSSSSGCAAATSTVVTHNWNTRDIQVVIRDNSTPYAQVYADVEYTSVNAITINFAVAPTLNQYQILLINVN
jgi:hypothetical protein